MIALLKNLMSQTENVIILSNGKVRFLVPFTNANFEKGNLLGMTMNMANKVEMYNVRETQDRSLALTTLAFEMLGYSLHPIVG